MADDVEEHEKDDVAGDYALSPELFDALGDALEARDAAERLRSESRK